MLRKFLLVVFAVHECLSCDVPTRRTNTGKIVGHYLTSYRGREYEAYQGVPYALPPIGDQRFKVPVPFEPWSNELLANKVKSACSQYIQLPSGNFIHGSEDCLYLNIFVPSSRAKNTNLPVVFWIHGGGFYEGSSVEDEEIFLMDYDVILVTVQYRLGILGFLSTEDEVVPGNMGLKDQSLALKWVHENIKYFGGDSSKITLLGQSAGGASVHFHYLSPMSAGLFQNGISMSGTAFNSWAIAKNPRQQAFQIGQLVNCTNSDVVGMVQCLRKQSVNHLIKAQLKFKSKFAKNTLSTFVPTVEKFSEHPFIDCSPHEIIESGKAYDAPWITGVVSEEGLVPTAQWIEDSNLKNMNDKWEQMAPILLGFYHTIPREKHARIARRIRDYYFGHKDINKKNFMSLVYMFGDRYFVVEAEKAARVQAKVNKSPVWFYYYNYRAVDSLVSKFTNSTVNYGVCHADDIFLVLKNDVIDSTKSARDLKMQSVLIDLLTTFSTNNEPDLNVKWRKMNSKNRLDYLNIAGPETSEIEMRKYDNLGQKEFWNSIGSYENINQIVCQSLPLYRKD